MIGFSSSEVKSFDVAKFLGLLRIHPTRYTASLIYITLLYASPITSMNVPIVVKPLLAILFLLNKNLLLITSFHLLIVFIPDNNFPKNIYSDFQ